MRFEGSCWMSNFKIFVFTSYYTSAEGVSYLLCEILRGESSKYDTPKDRRIVTGLSPNKLSKNGKSFLES